jgi:hypothetical protein
VRSILPTGMIEAIWNPYEFLPGLIDLCCVRQLPFERMIQFYEPWRINEITTIACAIGLC